MNLFGKLLGSATATLTDILVYIVIIVVFLLGVGMCVVVAPEDVETALAVIPEAYVLGTCAAGEKGVRLW